MRVIAERLSDLVLELRHVPTVPGDREAGLYTHYIHKQGRAS